MLLRKFFWGFQLPWRSFSYIEGGFQLSLRNFYCSVGVLGDFSCLEGASVALNVCLGI